MYICTIPYLTPTKLRESLLSFDWIVKVPEKKFPMIKYKDMDFSPFKENIKFTDYGLSTAMIATLPITYTPFSIIQSLTRKSMDYVIMNTNIQILDTVREVQAHCKCGNPMYYSLTKGEIIKECYSCRMRKLLSVIKK